MKSIPLLTDQNVFDKFKSRPPTKSAYFAMYSSWLGGITLNPGLMMVPVDDHIVHRGDGVFEALRFSDGAVFDFHAHMARLERSAKSIGIELLNSRDEVAHILREMVKAANIEKAMVRLYVSRGPGGFTTNPYEVVGPQLYIVLTELKLLPETTYANGVKAQFSKVDVKPSPWAGIKSCNYLPNVMMKKEALDAGVDFTIGLTPDGYIAEGSTENVAFVINGELCAPSFDYTLRGTTLLRVMDLANQFKKEVGLKGVRQADILREKALAAEEAFFIGTTLEVLPVTTLQGQPVGTGAAGPVAKRLRDYLQVEMRENPECRLVV